MSTHPLREDLQPGDVFARSRPISGQQEIYEEQDSSRSTSGSHGWITVPAETCPGTSWTVIDPVARKN